MKTPKISHSHPWPYNTTFHPCLGSRNSELFSIRHVKKAGLLTPLWITNFEIYYVGFEFPTAVGMLCAALWNVTPHSVAGDYQFLAGTYRLCSNLNKMRTGDTETLLTTYQTTQCHNSEHSVQSCQKDLLNFRTLSSSCLLDSSDNAILVVFQPCDWWLKSSGIL
jgi:hypothetical protein